MRFFIYNNGEVCSFDDDQLTNIELANAVASAIETSESIVEYAELEDAKAALEMFDTNTIDIAAAQSALDSSTFSLNLTAAQHKCGLEQSDDSKTALDLMKAEYESCDEYIALEAAKKALEHYQIAVQRVESAQVAYESCPEYIELERLKSTKIWIPNDAVEMTAEEIKAHLNPVITDEQLAVTARAQRDALLERFTWRYERHARETRLGIETTDSVDALDAYTQALADVPQQEGFPAAIEWPALPS